MKIKYLSTYGGLNKDAANLTLRHLFPQLFADLARIQIKNCIEMNYLQQNLTKIELTILQLSSDKYTYIQMPLFPLDSEIVRSVKYFGTRWQSRGGKMVLSLDLKL